MSGLDLPGALTRRRRRRRIQVVVAVLVLAMVVAIGWVASRPPGPEDAAEAFVTAWADDAPGEGPVDRPSRAATAWRAARDGLDEAPFEVALVEVTTDEDDPARATAELELTWTLPGDRRWSSTSTAPMVRTDDGWQVRWSTGVIHPDLPDGGTLALERVSAERADVLSADGTPLVTARRVVDVGIQPSRIEDLATTVEAVRDVLELDLEDLPERIEAADPDRFVPVVTLRDADYEQVRDRLHPIPGTVFRDGQQVLAPTRTFARATLGQVGPVTAELLEQHPDRFRAGDQVGLSGLQRAYDEQLAGRPGLEVRAVPPDGSDADPRTLFRVDPEPGTPVTVTLDPEVQEAADAALADQERFPTAAVVVRISDGHVLAVANGPAAGGLDLALTGRYPPGSTFKVVTTSALLGGGLGVDDPVPCPASTTVDGRTFTNAEDQALGEVPFRTAFANSCNTAFVELAADLSPGALRDAGAAFGLGVDPQLGVPAFGGDVPETEPGTDLAASAIGQGRLLVSPFAAANLAATAARGASLPAALVLDAGGAGPEDGGSQAPEGGGNGAAEDGGSDPGAGEPLPTEVADALPALMRAVVTDGSGTALADVPGEPVHAKTGTAEYGDDSPPRTHAWVVGWQGDLAFAVLVAETPDAYGGQVAAPIAADLLMRLAGG